MMYRVHRGMRGLGDVTATQVISAAGSGVSTGLSTQSLVAGGVAAGLATAAVFDPEPISKAILAISAAFVGPLTSLINRGCGNTCIVASNAANQATAAAEQVKAAYWGTPTPRPASLQQSALTALTQIANTLQLACSNPSLGTAGQNCISQRLVRGAPAPWCTTPDKTGCDYWASYYDPIANDPSVVDDSAAGTVVASALSTLGLPAANTATAGLIGIGLLALAVLFL